MDGCTGGERVASDTGVRVRIVGVFWWWEAESGRWYVG
jgi:hypothetical protein